MIYLSLHLLQKICEKNLKQKPRRVINNCFARLFVIGLLTIFRV